jgi:hypothetical protein
VLAKNCCQQTLLVSLDTVGVYGTHTVRLYQSKSKAGLPLMAAA